MSSSQGPQSPHRSARADEFRLGANQGNIEKRLAAWDKSHFGRRLWAGDPTLWVQGPAAEISNRLGWLRLPETMSGRLDALRGFADEIRAEGIAHVVLLGMGGSSLAPELFQKTLGNAPGHPALTVLDSTHPAAVAAVEKAIDLRRALFVVSSKSGMTIEPLSFFRYFWEKAGRIDGRPGRRFVAISDPGTPLLTLARDRGFRRAFEAIPDVGGRFSALTDFGLVPAALIGIDIDALLERAGNAAAANGPDVPAVASPALRLGAALGELALAGLDKLTIRTSPGLRSFPDWLEQLVAESTGKDGKGIVPIADEPLAPIDRYSKDRVFVYLTLEGEDGPALLEESLALEKAGRPVIRIRLEDKLAIGREIFDWEFAVAATGSVLGVHPFNQPDVELAKELARKTMAMAAGTGSGPAMTMAGRDGAGPGADDAVDAGSEPSVREAISSWLGGSRPRDYICLQTYLGPGDATARALDGIRRILLETTGLPVTHGRGPRFLHSTGQLHKGGPDEALVLQIVDRPADDLPIPETDSTFGALVRAQAAGDYLALKQRGRRVLRIDLGRDVTGGLARIAAALGG
jgi:transaldolase/glucose-6-phosphate isomerase